MSGLSRRGIDGGKSTRRLAIGKQLVKGGEVRRGDAARSGDHIAEKSRHCRREEVVGTGEFATKGRGRICSVCAAANLLASHPGGAAEQLLSSRQNQKHCLPGMQLSRDRAALGLGPKKLAIARI